VVPADPDRFDEAELHAWAAEAIGEPAARPKRIHPVPAIPTTEVGKPYKPALVADATARTVTDALADAGVPVRDVSASYQDGRLVVTISGADPRQVRDAVAGFALTITTLP
jgi:fatty-acyl-CoA synthase